MCLLRRRSNLSPRFHYCTEREEVVGVLGSSVLLDPEITVDSSKNDILWTFKASNKSRDVILMHIPGHANLEPSEQFKDRLQFNALSGALTINRLNASDQGDYTFTVDEKELKIMELLVIDKVKEEVGLLGSSVLLDPELKVDPSKSEIQWTFISRSILHHVPGHSLVELSDQFKFRLHFDTFDGALTVNGAEDGDQGDYTFIVDGQELRIIQLHLFGKDKEEIGLLGSSVLLDPELKVDPSKSEIVWTFISRNILHHVPGHGLVEMSDQFKFRLHFDTSNGALTVDGAEDGDQGDYTFIVDGQELRIIQLHLFDELSEGSILTNIETLGFTVELTCDVLGDSNVYQWQKNGGEISQRHQLTDENSTLVIPSASFEDCGVYTCITTNPVSSIQTNYTLMLQGLSLKDIIMIAVLTAGQVISAPSLHSAVLPDQWRWKTLGGRLGYRFYFLSLWICNTLSLITMYIVIMYWFVVAGLSPLDFVVIAVMIVGLQLSSFYINDLPFVTEIWELLKGSQIITIWERVKAVCDIVLINCFVIAWIVSATIFGLSTTGIVSIVLSIVLPIAFISIWMCRYIKVLLGAGYSIQDTIIIALQMLPLVNVMILFYLICTKKFHLVWWSTSASFFNLIFLLGISVSTAIPGFYSKDTVTIAASITMAVLLLVAFIPFVILWFTGFSRLRRWISVCNVGFLIVIVIATISWTAFKGLRREDVGVAVTSMVGLVFSTAYAIIFMCWSRKKYPAEREEVVGVLGSSVLLDPEITVDSSENEILWTFKASNKSHDVILDHIPGDATWAPSEQFKDRLQFDALSGALTISRLNASDQGDYTFSVDEKELKIMELLVFDDKQWWWRLNICNIVALVFILIALICWIVSKDQSCKINVPLWIILTVSGITFVVALSRFFPVCSRNERTNENNRGETEQDPGEMPELQPLGPGHEAEPENHPVS
ncbi:uncharacterized protein [Mobula birostris]|uniref:uncharacterized protein n=1 Tax=Mobula birostris TaxID=1983395 RepID=UPI003B27E2A8